MANYTLDLILIVIFSFVQWRITRIILEATPLRIVHYAIFFFYGFIGV